MFCASIFNNGSGAFRETGALRFLYYPKGALTHHLVVASYISFVLPQAAGLTHSAAPPLPTKQVCFAGTPFAGGGTAALRQPRALRGGLRSLRRAPDNAAGAAVPVIIVCAKGSVRRSLRMRKPATGSFIAVQGRTGLPAPAFSFAKEKQKKRLEVKTIGYLPFGGKGRQPGHGSICLRGFGLYELLRYL